MPEPEDAQSIVAAVRAVVATDARHAPESGSLLERVEAHLAAQRRLEEVLDATFDEDELRALATSLAERFTDPLDDGAAALFLESIGCGGRFDG